METSTLVRYVCCLVICAMLIRGGHADSTRSIKCYACESKKGGECTDTFQSSGVQMMECAGSCVKSYNSYKGHVKYSRYCAKGTVADDCTTTEYDTGSHIKCLCSTSYCNDGTIARPNNIGVLLQIAFICMLVKAFL